MLLRRHRDERSDISSTCLSLTEDMWPSFLCLVWFGGRQGAHPQMSALQPPPLLPHVTQLKHKTHTFETLYTLVFYVEEASCYIYLAISELYTPYPPSPNNFMSNPPPYITKPLIHHPQSHTANAPFPVNLMPDQSPLNHQTSNTPSKINLLPNPPPLITKPPIHHPILIPCLIHHP